MSETNGTAVIRLGALRDELVGWLCGVACPLWQSHGIDAASGAFEEVLGADGVARSEFRRARVQPRQVYAFTQAAALGWGGDASSIALRGIEQFLKYYRRDDGLYRTLVSTTGATLDDAALLYDQAFALLGFASAASALDAHEEYEAHARALRNAIATQLSASDGGYLSHAEEPATRESNPHMHLLEACQAWAEVGTDPEWGQWARKLAALATERVVRRDCGAIGEFYDEHWRPAVGTSGRRIEPGHQFEWAWLLLRAKGGDTTRRQQTALRLIEIGESTGVRDGFAINAVNEDGSLLDGQARLWPQTEWLKAVTLAATVTGVDSYWRSAIQAAESLQCYLRTPLAGLWFDVRLPNGEFVAAPAPASSFYHLVAAISALDTALAGKIGQQ